MCKIHKLIKYWFMRFTQDIINDVNTFWGNHSIYILRRDMLGKRCFCTAELELQPLKHTSYIVFILGWLLNVTSALNWILIIAYINSVCVFLGNTDTDIVSSNSTRGIDACSNFMFCPFKGSSNWPILCLRRLNVMLKR